MVESQRTWVGRLAAVLCTLMCVGYGALAFAQEDTGGAGPTFQEGDVISFDRIDAIKPFIPDEFWNNRDFFFYEGMQLEIGPFHRDYSQADAFKAQTEKHRGEARIVLLPHQ